MQLNSPPSARTASSRQWKHCPERTFPGVRSESGFSLLEMITATSISAVAFVILISALGASSDTYLSLSRVGRAEEDGRRAVDSIANDLRMADKDMFVITMENGANRVDFRVPTGYTAEEVDDHGGVTPGSVTWSTSVTIRYEPSSVDANMNGVVDEGRLVRIEDGRERVLCNYVEAGQFSVVRSSDHVAIRIGLIVSDGSGHLVQRSVETSVEFRNASALD